MKVWVLTASSESGDNYGPYVFARKPTKKKLEEIARDLDCGDGEGPGDFETYIFLTLTQAEVQ